MTSKRREPTRVAAFAVFATIVVLALRGAGLNDETPRPQVSVEVTGTAPRRLDIVVESPFETYATVHLVTADRRVQRIFPPLGRPQGIPWPLPAHEAIALFADMGRPLPADMAGFLVVRLVEDPGRPLEIPASLALEVGDLERGLDAWVFELEPAP